MINRWWIYQRERFPIFGHGPLILAFSFSAVSYSRLLRREPGLPGLWPAAVAFISCFLIFLQLRIADEFKDIDEDTAFRPYRPVPRGLVTLRSLGGLFVLAAAVQLALALSLRPMMALVLAVVWIYLAAMSKEFFAREWLKARPLTYMLTHMVIMPQIDFYGTSCDWLAAGVSPPRGLGWFLAVSFFNGLVVEIGRKIRAPADEERGVQTYSVVWGRRGAVAAWLLALALTYGSAIMAAQRIGFALPVVIVLGAALLLAIVLAARFLRQLQPRQGKSIEIVSGIWTLCVYLMLGAAPILVRYLGARP